MSDIRFDNNEAIDEKYLSLPKVETQKALVLPGRHLSKEKTAQEIEDFTVKALSAQNKEKRHIGIKQPKNNQNVLTVLQHSSPDFRKDKEKMLQAVMINHNAFEYASEELKKDPNFLVRAIKLNPAVYAHIPLETKLNEEFQKKLREQNGEDINMAYKNTMLRSVSQEVLKNGDRIEMPKQQFDKDYPWDINEYKKALEGNLTNVLSDPTSSALLSEDRKFMCAAQAAATQNPSLKRQLEDAEKDFYLSPEQQERALTIAKTQSRTHAGVDAYLQKMEEMNPELSKKHEEAQHELWSSREKQAEVLRAYKRIHTPKQIITRDEHEQDLDQKADKTLKEAKKRLKDVTMEDSLAAYLKGAYQDYIYALADAGRISDSEANLYVGMIGAISSPSLLHATVNDFDNGDFHMTPQEIEKVSQNLDVAHHQIEDNISNLHAVIHDAHVATRESLYSGYSQKQQEEEIELYLNDPYYAEKKQREMDEKAKEEKQRLRQKTIHNSQMFITQDYDMGQRVRK